ncbi:ribosomal L1 domain-containing protein 1-like [Adelges cooleyi]|uniref:ribosomal L1 domain-containing protein 1-like n=1 Tax=Adelges cooleyi TaxID=133065 RepID=UPI00217FFCDB|nr:ribosomal L1 domain-containing protein 1-like [Adelges cooleyi]
MKVKSALLKPKPQRKSLSGAIQKKKISKPTGGALKNVVKITDTFEELKAGDELTGISCANISKPIKKSVSKALKLEKKAKIQEVTKKFTSNDSEPKKALISSENKTSVKQESKVPSKKIKVLSKPRDTKDCQLPNRESDNEPKLDIAKVEEAVKGLFTFVQNGANRKKELWDEATPIHLTITAVKMGVGPKRVVRIALPNSLITETTDICLIVPDLIRGRNVDHEKTYHHYKDLLAKNGITNIKTILPSRQIRVEYNEYEARRNLCHSHDVFLIDQRISGFLVKKLGKEFYTKRKFPITVKLAKKHLKAEIESKLHKTSFFLDYRGTTKTLQVGHMKQTPKQVAENIIAVFNNLAYSYPGGLKNIRCLLLKTPSSESLPIYYSMISRNDVKGPYSQSQAYSKDKEVEGELFGKRVKVKPNGEVLILSGSEEEISDFGDEEDVVIKKTKKNISKESDNEEELNYSSDENEKEDVEDNDSDKAVGSDKAANDSEEEEDDGDDAEAEYLNEFEQSKKLLSKKKRKQDDKSVDEVKEENVKVKKNKKTPSKILAKKEKTSSKKKKLN